MSILRILTVAVCIVADLEMGKQRRSGRVLSLAMQFCLRLLKTGWNDLAVFGIKDREYSELGSWDNKLWRKLNRSYLECIVYHTRTLKEIISKWLKPHKSPGKNENILSHKMSKQMSWWLDPFLPLVRKERDLQEISLLVKK